MSPPPGLRFATFNLKDFFEARPDRIPDERAVVEAKLTNVAASLRRADADVVALQEVGSDALVRRLVTALADLGYGDPVIGSEDRRGIRNVILSRLPVQWSQIHQAQSLPFPRFVTGDPDPFAGRIPLRRGVVHVRVEAEGLGEVDVLTTHFKSSLPTRQKTADGAEIPDATLEDAGASAVRSLVQRCAEALFVRGLLDAVFAQSPDHAICVMGDFNDTFDSLPVRLLRGVDPASKRVLRSSAETIAAERRFSAYHGGGKLHIDHILLSERLHAAVARCEIHNEQLRDHGPGIPDGPLVADSDHALCLVELAAP